MKNGAHINAAVKDRLTLKSKRRNSVHWKLHLSETKNKKATVNTWQHYEQHTHLQRVATITQNTAEVMQTTY